MHKKLRLWLMTAELFQSPRSTNAAGIVIQRLMSASKQWAESGVRKIARRYLEEAYPGYETDLQSVVEVKSASDLVCSTICIDCTLLVSNRLSVAQLLEEQQRFLDTTKLPLWDKFHEEIDIAWRAAGMSNLKFSHILKAETYEVRMSLSLVEKVDALTVSWSKGELIVEKRFRNGKRRCLTSNLSQKDLYQVLRQHPAETWKQYQGDVAFS